ncbi:MAG: sugar ABC transporter permease [Anaerolineales bacterium]|jgi:raffinose/stachyose/melibiose transport system permease protein
MFIKFLDRYLTRKTVDAFRGYGFLLPALFLFVSIELFSILYNIYISFHKWNGFGKPEFIGFGNYLDLLKNDKFLNALGHNLIFWGVAIGVMATLALLIAVILDSNIPGYNIFRGLFFLPVITPMVVVSLVWKRVYSAQGGLLNQMLVLFNLPNLQHDWLGDPKTALTALLFVWVWRHVGYGVVIFYAGLLGISEDVKDAAAIDGASPWQMMWYVVLPLLRPTIYIVAVLFSIWGFKPFTLIYVMTRGGPFYATEVINSLMYDTVFRFSKLGEGATITTYVLIILLILGFIRSRLPSEI